MRRDSIENVRGPRNRAVDRCRVDCVLQGTGTETGLRLPVIPCSNQRNLGNTQYFFASAGEMSKHAFTSPLCFVDWSGPCLGSGQMS